MNASTFASTPRVATAAPVSPLSDFVSARIASYRQFNQDLLDARRDFIPARKKLRAFRLILRHLQADLLLQRALLAGYSLLDNPPAHNAAGVLEYLALHPNLSVEGPREDYRAHCELSRQLLRLARYLEALHAKLEAGPQQFQQKLESLRGAFSPDANGAVPWQPNFDRLHIQVKLVEDRLHLLATMGAELLQWHAELSEECAALGQRIVERHEQLCLLEARLAVEGNQSSSN